jgi:tetratricopeptide (TPR) repeat protein
MRNRWIKTGLTRAVIMTALLFFYGCSSGDREDAGEGKGVLDHYGRGVRFQREGKFEDALASFEKALQLDPDFAEAHLDIGVLYDDTFKDADKAVFHYREFLRLEPGSEKADMVARWIERAHEDKGKEFGGEMTDLPVPPDDETKTVKELERSKEEIAQLRVENEAYAKTIATLRDELLELKKEVETVVVGVGPAGKDGAGGEATGAPARGEAELRHFSEAFGKLEEKLASLKGEKAVSDTALQRARAEVARLRKSTAAGHKAGGETIVSLRNALQRAEGKLAKLDRLNSLYRKDNNALSAKLMQMENNIKQYNGRVKALEEALNAAETRNRATPQAAHLAAKMKADMEKEMREFGQAYEKKLLGTRTVFEKQKGELEQKLIETDKENRRLHARNLELESALRKMEDYQKTFKYNLLQQFVREKRRLQEQAGKQVSVRAVSREASAQMPAVEQQAVRKTAQQTGKTVSRRRPSYRSYKVKKGDTLTSIAERFYGNAEDWKRIYSANSGTLADPHDLHAGQTLRIP